MIKNLTEDYLDYLIKVVESVQPKNTFQRICDFFGDLILKTKVIKIEDYTDGVDAYHRDVLDMKNTTISELKQIFEEAWNVDSNYEKTMISTMETFADPVYEYIRMMNDMICKFDACSARDIRVRLGSLGDWLNENIRFMRSSAYSSEDGKYGGNQSNARIRWIKGEVTFKKEIKEIILRYYPDITDAEITDMLKEMEHEGCNFMAMVNTLIAEYQGREREFEDTFGFPLYDDNGNVNFDYIMTDYWLYSGYYDGKEGGLTDSTAESTWEKYLASKHVKVDVENVEVTVDNWDELKEDGEIIIGYSPLRLRNKRGQLVDDRDGGHATVITGVEVINGKKMYKVSSWGEVYYIDPDDYKGLKNSRVSYQQVRY